MPNADTLIRRWQQALAAGDITNRGLYTSELNRLERVQGLVDAGDIGGALEELDRFVEQVLARVGIEQSAAEAIADYARSVQSALRGA